MVASLRMRLHLEKVIHKCNLGAMNPLETRLNVLVQRLNALQEQVKNCPKHLLQNL